MDSYEFMQVNGKGLWPTAQSGGQGEDRIPVLRETIPNGEQDALSRIIEEEERRNMLEALGGEG